MFWEQRWSPPDKELEERLGDQEMVDLDSRSRRMRLFRPSGGSGTVMAETSGGRVLAMPGSFPISGETDQEEGLIWPGIDGAVDHARARGMLARYVYVDDRVLADYEGRPEYKVHPESGGVKFGTQWSVSFCDRVGRDMIRLELRKLYDGVPPAVIRRWHDFAVNPPAETSYATNQRSLNVAKRAKTLTYALVMLGENLAALARVVGLQHLTAEKFVVPRREDLDYTRWWSFTDSEKVARHMPKDAALDTFLDRGLALTKLLIEGLRERTLRATLRGMGVPEDDTKPFGTLKLLDCVIRLCQVAYATGLRFAAGDSTIWGRLSADGTGPQQPIRGLFALYDMRLLKAHRAEDAARLAACLDRFRIDAAETATGYGVVMDRVYDALVVEFRRANETIRAALDQ
jgi:hypothetical protein